MTLQEFKVQCALGTISRCKNVVKNTSNLRIIVLAAKHSNPYLRRAAARNPRTPPRLLLQLSRDDIGKVSTAAQESLALRNYPSLQKEYPDWIC